MEDDILQRPYSVCTRDDLKEKMNKQINDISEIFCVSNSNATVLLTKLKWNSELLQLRLSEDKKKVLMESGLTPVVVTDSSCQDLSSDDDWSEYLKKNFFSLEKTIDTISCPHQDCGSSVGRDTIEKLTFHEEIDDAEEYGLNVVCLRGHTFCGRCSLESHRPVTCNNASDWLSRDLKKLSEIGLDSLDTQFLPCAYCSGSFCWECMQSEESHKTESGCLEPVTEQDPLENGAEVVDTLCLDRWKACEVSMVEAKSEFEAFDESNNVYEEEYVKIMREGLMLIVQCRQFLKWSCVYEHLYLEYEPSKKDFMRFLQDYANTLVQSYTETLKEGTEKASRSNALRDGLDVVKVKHYDDFSPCWLCDRCTYANTWLHKACQMCYAK
ncbi:hypothetical protein N665_0063s0009 [Sinapis alba]|nr:hypothetical protein N665_0063s0009 [Sinapis alba]